MPKSFAPTDKPSSSAENQAAIAGAVGAPGRAKAKANGSDKGNGHGPAGGALAAVEERPNGEDQDGAPREKDPTQSALEGQGDGVDSDPQAFADAPAAGRHPVRLLRVTLVVRSGDRGYELLLQSGAHLWRPRPLWFRADRVPPAVVASDLNNVLVPLIRAVAAPGALTEAEAAEALTGLAFTATVDTSGAVTKAETPA